MNKQITIQQQRDLANVAQKEMDKYRMLESDFEYLMIKLRDIIALRNRQFGLRNYLADERTQGLAQEELDLEVFITTNQNKLKREVIELREKVSHQIDELL